MGPLGRAKRPLLPAQRLHGCRLSACPCPCSRSAVVRVQVVAKLSQLVLDGKPEVRDIYGTCLKGLFAELPAYSLPPSSTRNDPSASFQHSEMPLSGLAQRRSELDERRRALLCILVHLGAF